VQPIDLVRDKEFIRRGWKVRMERKEGITTTFELSYI
jgi:hypothetical protein